MNHITLVYPYFNNGSMLDLHLKEWNKYENKEMFSAIIVDDCSMRDPAEPHLIDVGFPISLYRITTDIPWNQNGARNLAMTYANGWCLITDIDHLLKRKHAKKFKDLKLENGYYYKPHRKLHDGLNYHKHPNSYILNYDLYWKAGGYDEDFCGYYGTDSTFRRQLEKNAVEGETEIVLSLYGRGVISDASTIEYGRKNSKYHVSNNERLKYKRKHGGTPIPPLNFDWYKVC